MDEFIKQCDTFDSITCQTLIDIFEQSENKERIENFGRPKSIELLILVNRRFSRELPIQADYIGIDVDVYSDEKVNVIWKDLVNSSYVTIEKIIDG